MCSFEILRRLSIATLVSCLALLFWIDIAGAAEMHAPQKPAGEPAEEIEVLGRRGRLALRAEIVNVETRMFNLFNEFNDERQFDVFCDEGIVTGSRIPERKCAPRYMKRTSMTRAQEFLFSDLLGAKPDLNTSDWMPGVSMNTVGTPPQTEELLWFHNNAKHRAFNEKFRELATRHPELNAIALDWQAKQRRLADMEAQQKKESVLGRFFGKFGRKDGN